MADLARPSAEGGFTLLEMLVALAVFSLAALSLIRLQAVTIRTASDLDAKVVGAAVARNLMVEWQTDPLPPSLGEAQGQVDNGGRRWNWSRKAAPTDERRLIRIDISVVPAAGGPASVLTFIRATA